MKVTCPECNGEGAYECQGCEGVGCDDCDDEGGFVCEECNGECEIESGKDG